MRELTKSERKPRTDARLKRPRVGAKESILQLELTSATLKDVMAAAEASGQSVSDWIRSAVDEAIARRS